MEEEIIENYIPSYNDFCFNFSSDECHFVKNGFCPVEDNKEKLLSRIVYNTNCKCEFLMKEIINKGFIERTKACEIIVMRAEPCEKYLFNNGRHRTCAASKLKIPIKIHLVNDPCSCMCDKAYEHLKIQ